MKTVSRKIIFVGIICMIILIVGFRLSTRRGIFDYFGRKLHGEYETTVDVTKNNDYVSGKYTFYFDGKYYVWNQSNKAFFDYMSNEAFIYLERKPDKIVTNDSYIYAQIDRVIYQYDKQGKLINKIDDRGELIFAGEKSIYCVSSKYQAIFILSSEDISSAGEVAEATSRIFPNSNIEIVAETSECYLGIPLEDLTTKIETTKEYVQVATRGYYEMPKYIISKETGVEQTGVYFECMMLNDKGMYTGYQDELTSMYVDSTEVGCVKEIPVEKAEETIYSKFSRSQNFLIVLGERYFMQGIGNRRDTASGNLGDYDKANLCYIDLETEKVVKEYEIKNEQVIYADSTQYVTLRKGVIKFYSLKEEKVIRTETIKNYQPRHDYQIEISGGKIFVFCDEKFVDCVETM